MYNLTVDEAHTFFVGDGDWLVHNCQAIRNGKRVSVTQKGDFMHQLVIRSLVYFHVLSKEISL